MPGAGWGRDALFSPLESSLEVFGIRIDAAPGGHLAALSRAGQTFRASVTPSLREVGIWGMSALRLGKPAYFEGPLVSHGNSIFVLHLSLLRLLHENAHKIHQVSIWWCANPKEPYTVHVFQN
jgi:hypothetical protein